MRGKTGNLREELILAGIDEINSHGISDFSIRRIAKACDVSCAAPYRHFESKQDFIAAIIDYVNDLWAVRQEEVLAQCSDCCQERMLEICINYVRFLMERPIYRTILMLHDDEFNNMYHKKQTPFGSVSQAIIAELYKMSGLSKEKWQRKVMTVRAAIFGTIVLFDAKEFEYNEENMENLRYILHREIITELTK